MEKNFTNSFLRCCLRSIPLLLLGLLLTIGTTDAQRKTTYSVDIKNGTLEQVFNHIENQGPHKFMYNSDEINTKQQATIKAKDEPLEQILTRLFRGRDIAFKVEGEQVVLTTKKRLKSDDSSTKEGGEVYTMVVTAENEGCKVKGRILEAGSDEPVGFATVFIRGADNKIESGTTSDADGNFAIISMNPQSDVVVVRYIGYEVIEEAISDRNTLDIELIPHTTQTEEVVVTGYQTISRERATGSFDVIQKELIERPTGNIGSRLIGSAAGLTGTQDAYGNPIFEIRGRSSLSSEATQPLLVVDGFAIEGGFESINPNDVESISVLKDAAAASIWGAKSANGVIVITTKQGRLAKDGRATVSVDFSGFLKVSPKMDYDYAFSRASVNDIIDYETYGYDRFGSMFPPTENSYSGDFSRVYELITEHRLGHISESDMNSQIEGLRKMNNKGQIKKYLLQNPIVHQENLSINIATNRSTNVLSTMYQNDRRHFKKQNSNKIMVSFRNRTNLFKWLDLSLNGTYVYDKHDNSGLTTEDITLSPYEMLRDENGDLIKYSKDVNLNYLNRHVPMGDFPYQDWGRNPLEELNNRRLKTVNTTVRFQAGLTFNIWDGLTFDSKVQYEMVEGNTSNYYNDNTYTVRNAVNSATTWDKATDEVTHNLPLGGFLDQNRSKLDVITIRNQLNFNKVFAHKHAIAFVGGVETIDRTFRTYINPRTYGYNHATLGVGNFPNGVGGSGIYRLNDWQGNNLTFDYQNQFAHSTDRYFSAFGNASYTYDYRYTISGSVRTDASNLITDDASYRYSPFWSVGGSWQIANEQFMRNATWVNSLKVRFTYGYNGNVDKTTTFKPLITTGTTPDLITGSYIGSIASYGNPNLRWEKTGTWDFGVDFSFWNGKLHGKVDVYKKTSKDLIANMNIPALHGTTSMKLNNGEMVNKGFEIELGSAFQITRDVAWHGSMTLAYNHNRITNLKLKQTMASQLVVGVGHVPWMEGKDMNTLWAYKYGGVVNVGSEANPNWQPSLMHKDGRLDTFSFQTITSTDDPSSRSYNMGTKVAPWDLTFYTGFKVYDFDISMIITGKFGHKFLRESFNYPPVTGRALPNAKYGEIKDADPSKRIPLPMQDNEPMYGTWSFFYPYMSYLAENAGHIRFQELNITYNIPQRISSKIGMQSLQVYMQCNNLFNIYFNSYSEDPEFKRGSLRLQPSYTFGLKCRF